jgi:hypothetical protein
MNVISIARDREECNECDINICISMYVPSIGECEFTFTYNASSPIEAGFIADRMREEFERRIELIREVAYNKGWEDKRKRNRKEDFFGWCFNTINPWK